MYFFNEPSFFTNHWQKMPWHGKNIFDVQHLQVSPEDLNDFSTHPSIDTRLIVQKGTAFSKSKRMWSSVKEETKTLFIQDMQIHFPEIFQLQKSFSNYPEWRTDDVMGSFGTQGASSSPHVDFYDVFIVQVQGKKLWRIENEKRSFKKCKGSALIDHPDLHVLKEFFEAEEYLLEPGDVLYVPTRFAHEAIAQTDSFSLSVGFRAPRIKDIIARIDSKQSTFIDEDLRMEEAHIYQNRYEIPSNICQYINNWPTELASPPEVVGNWFGELVTNSETDPFSFKFGELDQDRVFSAHQKWTWNPSIKKAFQYLSSDCDSDVIFIHGQNIQVPKEASKNVTKLLSSTSSFSIEANDPWMKIFFHYLWLNEIIEEV
ncbi:MAG: hypothetical protein KDD46_03080 [Bdellovibrionales bacterium]|nr:hypothetical protein [Bdellovibrionales bacterium]